MAEQPSDDNGSAWGTGPVPLEALKPYLALASGFVEMSAGKAAEIAQALLAQGAATGAEAQERMETLAALGLDPDQLTAIVRDEVDKVTRRIGFVRSDEIAALRRQVDRLEVELEQVRGEVGALAATVAKSANKKSGKPAKSEKKHGKHDGAQGEGE